MATIAQRLIAAGASPERARAFETQFTKKVQTAQPTAKTKDIQDAFDEELRSLSEAVYPNAFRPPAIDDPRIDSYIAGLFGKNKLEQLQTDVLKQNAPTYYKIKNSLTKNSDPATWNLEQTIVSAIEAGQTPAVIAQNLIINRDDLWDGFTEAKVTEFVNSLSNEYDKAQSTFPVAKEKLLTTNKYYKAGLPDPKFVYDKREDLAQGKIAWTTHPSVKKIIEAGNVKVKEQLAQTYGPAGPQSSAAAGIAALPDKEVENLFIEFKASGASPFKDEVKRREFLKGKTLK